MGDGKSCTCRSKLFQRVGVAQRIAPPDGQFVDIEARRPDFSARRRADDDHAHLRLLHQVQPGDQIGGQFGADTVVLVGPVKRQRANRIVQVC